MSQPAWLDWHNETSWKRFETLVKALIDSELAPISAGSLISLSIPLTGGADYHLASFEWEQASSLFVSRLSNNLAGAMMFWDFIR